MSKKLYEESNISNIASAIREKNGTQNQYTVAQMASAVRAIKTQPALQEKTIVNNGSYTPDEGFDGFSEVTVQVPSGGDSAVIQPLTVTQNGVYNLPSGVDGFGPVTVNVDSYSPEGSISAGITDPTASSGSNGDIYIKYLDASSDAIKHTYAAKVTKFMRGTGVLDYVSAAEIDLVFDNGAGGEVSIRDISDFSYWATNRNGNINRPSQAFDGRGDTFNEYNPAPVTWFMSATIPPAYTPKTLRVMQRNYNGGTDVWSSFTLSDALDDVDVSVEILSEENLQTTDWAGVNQWTDFSCNGGKIGGKIPLKYFVKENGSWNEITKDAVILGITEIIVYGGGGTASFDNILVGSTDPDANIGTSGDMYIKTFVNRVDNHAYHIFSKAFYKSSQNVWLNDPDTTLPYGVVTIRIKTHSTGGNDASIDVYVNGALYTNILYTTVQRANAHYFEDIYGIFIGYNMSGDTTPDGNNRSGWAIYPPMNSQAYYLDNWIDSPNIVKEWVYNVSVDFTFMIPT